LLFRKRADDEAAINIDGVTQGGYAHRVSGAAELHPVKIRTRKNLARSKLHCKRLSKRKKPGTAGLFLTTVFF